MASVRPVMNFLSEEVGFAVDDLRHDNIVSTWPLSCLSEICGSMQANSLCPTHNPVPSPELLRLQFWPKTKHANVSLQYTGRHKVKYNMVQQRQWHKSHP
jgi:hypothetical protein